MLPSGVTARSLEEGDSLKLGPGMRKPDALWGLDCNHEPSDTEFTRLLTTSQGEDSNHHIGKRTPEPSHKVLTPQNSGGRVSTMNSVQCCEKQVAPAPYFCAECCQLVCDQCQHLHSGHGTMQRVAGAALNYQRHLQEKLEDFSSRLDGLRNQRAQLKHFDESYAELCGDINSAAAGLIAKIGEHQERLLKEANSLHRTALKRSGLSHDELNQNILTLDIVRRRARSAVDSDLATKDPQTFLASNKQISHKLDSFENLLPRQDATFPAIKFSAIRCNTAFGNVEISDPSVNVMVHKKFTSGGRSISLPSSPDPAEGATKNSRGYARAIRHSDGSTPTSPGTIPDATCCKITPNDTAARGPRSDSPSLGVDHMKLRESRRDAPSSDHLSPQGTCLWSITAEGSKPGEINCPNDVALLFDDSVVVSDRDNNRLQIFDSQGNYVKAITAPKFRPRRLAINAEGNIAVTDAADSCVKVFDLSGQCLHSWGRKWYKNVFKTPCGIAVDSQQRLIVSDMDRHTVSVFNMDGKQVRQLPSEGHHDFHSPAYITTDKQDRIIVADNWQQCVKVFDSLGHFAFQFNSVGGDGGVSIEYPNGVCCDEAGNIYVAEWGTHNVSKFTANGEFVGHILTRADGLYHPAGIAISGDKLAVTAYSDAQSMVALYAIK